MSHLIPESARVDRAYHLAEHPRRLLPEPDLRMEAGRCGRLRGGADHHGRERKQVVRLDDHGMASTLLNSATTLRQLDRMHVTANHAAAPSAPRPRALHGRRPDPS